MALVFGSADKLRKAIEDSGKSYEQVALECRIAKKSLYRYVSGERMPTCLVLGRLCYSLKVSADYVLGISCKENL